jgi:hypothetical protein
MREIRPYGSEGGGTGTTGSSYLYGMRGARLWLLVHGCRSFDVGCRRDAGAPRWSSHGSGSPCTAMAPSTSNAGETPARPPGSSDGFSSL